MRDVWTLHGIQSNCIAAIWRNDFGLELRVLHGGGRMSKKTSSTFGAKCQGFDLLSLILRGALDTLEALARGKAVVNPS